MPIFKRRRRTEDQDRRAYVIQLATEEFEDGDSKRAIRKKVRERMKADATARPLVDLLLSLFDKLWPFLEKLLNGLLAG